jgi:hypothetical protein
VIAAIELGICTENWLDIIGITIILILVLRPTKVARFPTYRFAEAQSKKPLTLRVLGMGAKFSVGDLHHVRESSLKTCVCVEAT